MPTTDQRLTSGLFATLVIVAIVAVDPWGWDETGPLRWALVSTLAAVTIAVSFGGERPHPPLTRPERWGLISIATGAGLGILVSPEPLHAIIGTPDRHFGAGTWLLCLGLFTATRRTPVNAWRVAQAATVAASILGLWTALELLEIGWFASSFADDRAGGPFAQPAYLGAASVLLTPLASAFATRPGQRITGLVGVSGGLLALLGSGSRGAALGAAAAIAVALVGRGSRSLQPRAGVAAVAVIVLGFVTPLGGRLAAAVTGSTAANSRLAEWETGVRAWTDSPGRFVTGWGPEGYRTAFGRAVDDEYVIAYGREVITDRAHSGIIDIGLTIGLIGLAGWALLIGSTLLAARRHTTDPVTGALLVSIVGYVGQQLFLFPVAELDLIAFGLLGLLGSRCHEPGSAIARPNRPLVALAIATAALAAFAGIADVAADRAIAASPPDAARAVDLRPDSIRYAFIEGRVVAGPTETSLRTALEAIERGRELAPADPALRLEAATIHLDLARTASDAAVSARTAIAAFVADDPRHPQLLMQYGIALALTGDINDAREQLATAARLAPADIEPRINLLLVLLELGARTDAIEVLQEAEAIAPADPRLAELRRELFS